MISLTIHATCYGIHWREYADEPVQVGADCYVREFRNLIFAAEYLAGEGFTHPPQPAPCTADAWLSTGPDATPAER